MLELAWEIKDKRTELVAYEKMGIMHFNLGDTEKAAAYHNRMVRGKYESDSSQIRKLQLNALQVRRYRA